MVDTGIGIDKEDLNIIFDEFRQVSEGWGRNHGGSGLGLSICKKYMELLGGKISVTSKPGSGSDFKLVIPKFTLNDNKKSAEDKMKSDSDFKPSETSVNQAKTTSGILYVEDEYDSIQLVKHIIENKYELDIAKNDKECMKKVKDNKYTLILMDINLKKGKSGLELLSEIKKIKHYKDVPVIAVTAYAMKGDREEFINAGCTDYISKPFAKKDLLEKISLFYPKK